MKIGNIVILCLMFFIFGTILVLPIFSKKDILVKADDPENPQPYIYHDDMPNNAFGSGSYKEVNWSFFKQMFQDHFYKNAMYKRYSYSSWVDGSSYVGVNKVWNDTGNFWKINITLDIPVDIYEVNISFGCDIPVLNYIEKSGTEIWLNYTIPNSQEIYSVYFNYSDIASIQGLTVTRHNENGIWWISLHKNNIPSGFYVFDPTFGSTSDAGNVALYTGGTYQILGVFATMGGTEGTADKLTFKTGVVWTNTENVQGAIYEYVDHSSSYCGNLVGVTDIVEVTSGTTSTEVDLPFSSSPSLSASTNYYLCVRITTTCAGTQLIRRGIGTSNGIRVPDSSILTFDDPLTGEIADYDIYCYCTYTEGGAPEWNILINNSDFSFGNILNQTNLIMNGDFSFGNTLDETNLIMNGDFSFGNLLNETNLIMNGDFSFGNILNETNLILNGDFSFGNILNETNLIMNGDFTFGNILNETNLIMNGDFTFGNILNETNLILNGDFSFGNILNQTNLIMNGDFSFGNGTAPPSWHGLITDNNFTFGNILNQTNLILNGDFSFGNTTGWHNLIMNNDFTFGNESGLSDSEKIDYIYDNMLTGESEVEIEFSNEMYGIIITLVLFLFFFFMGYSSKKRSGGAFLMFSGFILLALEYMVASYLNTIVIAFLSPFAIFIILLGIRKWFFMPEGEKTKSEGQ